MNICTDYGSAPSAVSGANYANAKPRYPTMENWMMKLSTLPMMMTRNNYARMPRLPMASQYRTGTKGSHGD